MSEKYIESPEQIARFKQMNGKNLIYIPPMSAMFFGSVHPSTKAFVQWMRCVSTTCAINFTFADLTGKLDCRVQ
jgi:hypothetical protein